MKEMKAKVLGEEYTVKIGKRKEVGLPKEHRGECHKLTKEILVEHSMRYMDTEKERDMYTKAVIAHEIFHAFVKESGLDIPDHIEEQMAVWYEEHWDKMNKCIRRICTTYFREENDPYNRDEMIF